MWLSGLGLWGEPQVAFPFISDDDRTSEVGDSYNFWGNPFDGGESDAGDAGDDGAAGRAPAVRAQSEAASRAPEAPASGAANLQAMHNAQLQVDVGAALVPTLKECQNGAIRMTERQLGPLAVTTLADGTETCYSHREALKEYGFRWNSALKQWGRCVCISTGKPKVLELLQMGVLNASELPGGVVVSITSGFGSTYDFQHSLEAADFRFHRADKSYRKNASDKMLDAVRQVNASVAAHVEAAAKARRQKRRRDEEQTFQPISDGIERALDAYMARKRAVCYVGMALPATQPSAEYLLGSKEAVDRWNYFHDNYDFSCGMYVK